MEDSVGLALQSCLGGRASDFHVSFQSHNHFRISVFSIEVGFFIYRLRRITTSQFDLYFHLWSNGMPHWENEKWAWELEQEKEWTVILSRAEKRQMKKKESRKKVRFAQPVVQPSSQHRSVSIVCIRFGAFESSINPDSASSGLVFSPSSSKCSLDQ